MASTSLNNIKSTFNDCNIRINITIFIGAFQQYTAYRSPSSIIWPKFSFELSWHRGLMYGLRYVVEFSNMVRTTSAIFYQHAVTSQNLPRLNLTLQIFTASLSSFFLIWVILCAYSSLWTLQSYHNFQKIGSIGEFPYYDILRGPRNAYTN